MYFRYHSRWQYNIHKLSTHAHWCHHCSRPALEQAYMLLRHFQELVDTGQELLEYEPDEDEKINVGVIKLELKWIIDSLKQDSTTDEKLAPYKEKDETIKENEKKLKETKATLKENEAMLELKLELKPYGAYVKKQEDIKIIKQAKGELVKLNAQIEELIAHIKGQLNDVSDYEKIEWSASIGR